MIDRTTDNSGMVQYFNTKMLSYPPWTRVNSFIADVAIPIELL